MNNLVLIENRILTLRGKQVMIDRDLAEMYQVETKRLNEAVKRNIERFPKSFRFQLNSNELEELVANCDRFKTLKHSSSNPYAFTEQGVAMLSAILKSKIAIQVSIQIMEAFVQMRKVMIQHQGLLELRDEFTLFKADTHKKFEEVFRALVKPDIAQKQGVFFDGQIYDAYSFISDCIKSAKKSIILVDNYLDDNVITQLTKKNAGVKVYLISKNISKKLQLDINKANEQYPDFKAIEFNKAHDRFLILDEEVVYHIGASLKDLGKKWFAFSKIEGDSLLILRELKRIIHE